MASPQTAILCVLGPPGAGKRRYVSRLCAGFRVLELGNPSVALAAQSRPQELLAARPVVVRGIERATRLLDTAARAPDAGPIVFVGEARPAVWPSGVTLKELRPRPVVAPLAWARMLAARDAPGLLSAVGKGLAEEAASQAGFLDRESRSAGPRAYLAGRIEALTRFVLRAASAAGIERLCAALLRQAGKPLGLAAAAREAAVPFETARRYLDALERCYLIELLPARAGSPAVAPLVLPLDPWILAESGLPAGQLRRSALLTRLCRSVPEGSRVSHWRTHSGAHADLVVETGDGGLAVVVRETPIRDKRDLRGMKRFLDQLPGGMGLVLSPHVRSPEIWGERIVLVPLLKKTTSPPPAPPPAPAPRPAAVPTELPTELL